MESKTAQRSFVTAPLDSFRSTRHQGWSFGCLYCVAVHIRPSRSAGTRACIWKFSTISCWWRMLHKFDFGEIDSVCRSELWLNSCSVLVSGVRRKVRCDWPNKRMCCTLHRHNNERHDSTPQCQTPSVHLRESVRLKGRSQVYVERHGSGQERTGELGFATTLSRW